MSVEQEVPKLDVVFLGHEIAAQQDAMMYEEELVSAVAYDEAVEKLLLPVARRKPPQMTKPELHRIKTFIETEFLLEGESVMRAIARGTRQVKRQLGITEITD